MKYLITKFIHHNRATYQLSLLFGEDWNQNTQAKRWKYKR